MYCPKCHKEIPDGAMFCNYCGAKVKVDHEKSNKISNNLLTIWLVAYIILSLLEIIVPWLVKAIFGVHLDVFYIITVIAFNLIMLLPVLAISNKTYRIIGLVIMSIIILIRFIEFITDFFGF